MAVYLGRPPEDRYTRVPNDWLRDPKIRGLAKAVLAYLLSHQSGYALTVKQMAAEFKEGEDALYAAVNELIKAGYVLRQQRRGQKGVVGQVDFLVIGSDGAFPQVATASGFPGSGEPGSGATSTNVESPQVMTASGFSASGSAGSGESGTKKTMSKKTKDLEDQNNTNPLPSVHAADVVEGELVEEGEEGFASQEQRINTLIAEITSMRTRQHWKRADIAKHVGVLVDILDGDLDVAEVVARATAEDRATDFPSRISHPRNPHLQNARQALLFASMDALDFATGADEPEPGTHPYEPGPHGRCAVADCGMPEPNVRQHGRRRPTNSQPRTSTRALPRTSGPGLAGTRPRLLGEALTHIGPPGLPALGANT